MISRRGVARLGALLLAGALAPYLAGCGGYTETLRNDTWTFDGRSWTQQHVSLSPPARRDASMAYHAATGTILLFGGIPVPAGGGHPVLADTWTWNGSAWAERNVTTGPSGRTDASMAGDPVHQTVVLFGGNDGNTELDDTWIWNGSAWSRLTPANRPSARAGAAMAYDERHGVVVLFGGATYTGDRFSPTDDTWLWDGANWNRMTPPSSPSARIGATMTYDPGSRSVILFGGATVSGGPQPSLHDTWSWDGEGWTELQPSISPPGRSHTFTASIADGLLLFSGGADNGGILSDTWIWDGANWAELHVPSSPPGRWGHTMAFDSGRRTLVLFGGQ